MKKRREWLQLSCRCLEEVDVVLQGKKRKKGETEGGGKKKGKEGRLTGFLICLTELEANEKKEEDRGGRKKENRCRVFYRRQIHLFTLQTAGGGKKKIAKRTQNLSLYTASLKAFFLSVEEKGGGGLPEGKEKI